MTGDGIDASEQPVVAVVCRVPLLADALAAELEGVAAVRRFPAGRGGTAGLLRSLDPAAVVVDEESEADEATALARERGVPLVHVSFREGVLRVFGAGGWSNPGGELTSAAVRNALVGGILGKGRR